MAYHGKYFKGARRTIREEKRREAEHRNSLTPETRTREYREGPAHLRKR